MEVEIVNFYPNPDAQQMFKKLSDILIKDIGLDPAKPDQLVEAIIKARQEYRGTIQKIWQNAAKAARAMEGKTAPTPSASPANPAVNLGKQEQP
jgi:hypothetical protein